MNKLIAPILAIGLLVSGCSWLSAPVTPVNPTINTQVETTFSTLDIALSALSLVPGVPANVITEAKALDVALQAGWAAYQANPTATNETALLNGVIAEAGAFLKAQEKVGATKKALHAPIQ